jgi:hypothetical protein
MGTEVMPLAVPESDAEKSVPAVGENSEGLNPKLYNIVR